MMNLIRILRKFSFLGKVRGKTMVPVQAGTAERCSLERMLSGLRQACADLSGGEAFLTVGDGEFCIRLKWTAEENMPKKKTFRLNGLGEMTEWVESGTVPVNGLPEEAVKGQAVSLQPDLRMDEKTTVKEVKPSRQQQMMQKLVHYLKLHYAFRYNLLTEQTECARMVRQPAEKEQYRAYMPVDNRLLNGIAFGAMYDGIDCWDRDVKRYLESDQVESYHPFTHYFRCLPAWDGTDRVTELARRVSDNDLWVRSFHRWMLAVTAQWTGVGNDGRRANSVAPILVSTVQGLGKSTFCRMLLPDELRPYFTESFDLTNASGAENKLASYGLISLDEFDRLPVSRMSQLKNLMQMEDLRIRRAYRRSAEVLPRIASFIGTSNRRDLLTDLSGSRRFICVEVSHPIDCVTPVNHVQLYAQLLHELYQGERCWFSKEEEMKIQEANHSFYRVTPAQELFGSCFCFAGPGETGAHLLSAAEIYTVLKQQNPVVLQGYTCTSFARLMAGLGRRVHTRYGNGYWVRRLK